jgi:hypothetical protein
VVSSLPTEPFVLVSYRHESEAHAAAVAGIVRELRGAGFVVAFDQDLADAGGPIEGWTMWMEHAVDRAAAIVTVWSAGYRAAWDSVGVIDAGRGVRWESRLLRSRFYDHPDGRAWVAVVLQAADRVFVSGLIRNDWTTHVWPDGVVTRLRHTVSGSASVPAPVPATEASPVAEPRLRIVHVADLGADGDGRWRRDPWVGGLAGCIGALRPDVIAVTGGLVAGGARAGAQEAVDALTAWRSAAGLGPERLWIVPGPSDRDATTLPKVQRSFLGTLSSAKDLDQVLADPAANKPFHRPLVSFRAALKGAGAKAPSALAGVRPVALDSATWATPHGAAIGGRALAAALQAAGGGAVTVALCALPVDRWASWDAAAVGPILRARTEVMLTGAPVGASATVGARALVTVGSSFEGDRPTFHVVDVSPGWARATPWVWVNAVQEWREDLNTGTFQHRIGEGA